MAQTLTCGQFGNDETTPPDSGGFDRPEIRHRQIRCVKVCQHHLVDRTANGQASENLKIGRLYHTG